MKTTKRYQSRRLPFQLGTPHAKIAFSYLAAYMTAFAVIGLLYFCGLFDVGFFSKEGLGLRIIASLLSVIPI